MLSALYFVIYTFIVVLSLVFPDNIVLYSVLAALLTIGTYILKVLIPFKYYSSIKEDDIRFVNISDVTDLPYGSAFVIVVTYIILIAALCIGPIFIPSIILWVLYAATVIVTYVYPTVSYAISRVRFYFRLREKGFRLSISLRELMLLGKRNIHYISVRSEKRDYKIGILGGVGCMRYWIGDNKITSQKVNPVLRVGILELERVNSELVNLLVKIFTGKRMTHKLQTEEECEYLILQPNAFIEYEDRVVDTGDTVNGMRVYDMRTGVKYIR